MTRFRRFKSNSPLPSTLASPGRILSRIVIVLVVASSAAYGTPPSPPNDDFADRILLEGADLDLWGTNVNATIEPAEPWEGTAWTPELSHSIWWAWTAPADGLAVMSVGGSSFQSVLRVFRGDTLADLAEIYPSASLGISVEQGVTYALQVGGSAWLLPAQSSGAIRLKLSFFEAPPNTQAATASQIGELPAVIQGSTAAATTSDRSVWWSWTAPLVGTITATLQARPPEPQDELLPSRLHSSLAVYQGPNPDQLELVDYAEGEEAWQTVLAQTTWKAVAGTTYYFRVDGQFHWHAGFSLSIAMNRPPTLAWVEPIGPSDRRAGDPLTVWVAANDPEGSISRVDFLLTDFLPEIVRVGSDPTPPYRIQFTNMPSGDFQLYARAYDNAGAVGNTIPLAVHVRPVNGDFKYRIPISGAPLCVELDPNAPGETWWSWTAPNSALYHIRSENDGAQLTLYTGATMETLIEIAATTSEPLGGLSFQAQEGMSYVLAVGGYPSTMLQITPFASPSVQITFPPMDSLLASDEPWAFAATTGDPDNVITEVRFELDREPLVTLSEPPFRWVNNGELPPGFHSLRATAVDACGWRFVSEEVWFRVVSSRPPNDAFADRIAMPGTAWQTQAAVGDATRESGEPAFGERSLWWSWTAPSDGPCVLRSTSSRPYNSHGLVVFEGDSLENLIVTAEGEPLGPYSSHLSWEAIEGTVYAIAIYGYVDRDTAELELIQDAPPSVTITGPAFGASFEVGDTVTLMAEAADPDGSIAAVEFYQGEELLGTVIGFPYHLEIATTDGRRRWSFYARAIDDDGVIAHSDYSEFITLPPSPDNDAFQNRLPFADAPASVNGGTYGSTLEPGEPNPNAQPGSVWWTWTTSTAGVYTVQAQGANYDWPAIAVFTGVALDQLTLVTNNAFLGGNSGYTAQATFAAETGIAYQLSANADSQVTLFVAPTPPPTVSIHSPLSGTVVMEGDSVFVDCMVGDEARVARVEFYREDQLQGVVTNAPFQFLMPPLPKGWNQVQIQTRAVDEWGLEDWSGPITLNQTPRPPFNDPYAGRPIWEGAFHEFSGTFRGAITDENDPDVPGQSGARSLWWQWTAPMRGKLLITLQSSTSLLAVYTGTEIQSLTPVEIFPVSGSGPAAQFTVEAIKGATYQIALYESNGYDSDFSGSLFLDARHLELDQPPWVETVQGRFWTTFDFPWTIERTSGLDLWTPVATSTPIEGQIQFTDSKSPLGPVLYRARAAD